METFLNTRIEGPFQGSYKGYNQYLFTGGIDDLFFVDASRTGTRLKLCRIREALQAYGQNEQYDLVLTLNADMTLEFGNSRQKSLFDSITRGDSTALVEPEHRNNVRSFVPRRPSTALLLETNNRQAGNTVVQQAVAETTTQVQENDKSNTLGQITRLLKCSKYRTLVIVPEAERLLAGGNMDGAALHRLEIVVKDWRNIIQSAHPDSRTILIVNPHRLNEFHSAEHHVSSFDHNCSEVVVGDPPVSEMRAWLDYYKLCSGIGGVAREAARVILTGKASIGGNLQNFVGWVQNFYLKNPGVRDWNSLLRSENIEASEAKEDLLEELEGMIGLDEVKKEIRAIVETAERNMASAANATYHMFFLGNPGTGKTVVANIVAKLFWAMELRTSRTVVTMSIQDVISQYNEGDTIQRMKDKVREAMGGVLFIDEAYLFAESEWGRKAFETLLTEMENNRTNLTVILAGYEDRLFKLKDINPGIDSRIPIRLHFRDYTKDQKFAMFKLFLDREEKNRNVAYKFARGVEEKLLRVLDGCEGNGRGVRNLLERILQNLGNELVICDEHVVDPHAPHPDEVAVVMRDLDKNFQGMQGMKTRLRQYFRTVEWNLGRNQKLGLTRRGTTAYRIRFTGSPGTGKTTIARYMGRFFHAMGICETDQCVECGATSLKGAYVGQAQQTVNNLFHENRGKVIFIDEIYSLYNPEARQDDSYSREVIDTLVRCLTAEENQGTVVVVAGYKNKVDQFMEANPGLASRFPDEIFFEDYSAEDCVAIFKSTAERNSYRVSHGCDPLLEAYFDHLKKKEGDKFGNARDVNISFGVVVQKMVDRLSEKPDKTKDDYCVILPEDIPGYTRPTEQIPSAETENSIGEDHE